MQWRKSGWLLLRWPWPSGWGWSVAAVAQEEVAPIQRSWSFDGLFGTFDLAAAQRGLQVYREVCSACHSLNYIAFRNLTALGFTDDQVKALASQYQITDGPNDQGEMYQEPGQAVGLLPATLRQ